MMRLPIVLVFALHISDVQIQAQAPSGTNCICTPFYECFDSETVLQGNDPSACQDVLDVCCHNLSPPSPQTPSGAGDEVGIRQHDECGVSNITGVCNSEGQAQYCEFPWMVSLLTTNTGLSANSSLHDLYVGGGSLIDPLVVLTTANMPIEIGANRVLSVRVGERNFREVSEPTQHQDIRVKEIIYYPRMYHDLRIFNYALLILERPAILGETVRTICLPSNPEERFDAQQCITGNWGKDVFGEDGNYQRIMKSVTVNMVEHSQCQSALQSTRLGSRFILHPNVVCAGDQGQDSCTGDGGSPLVCPDPMSPGQYVLVGASAWSIGCGQLGIPGLYAAMAPKVDWIQETLDKIFNITEEEDVGDRTVFVGIEVRAPPRIQCPKCQNYRPRTKKCHKRLRCRRT